MTQQKDVETSCVVRLMALTQRDAELTARILREAGICSTSHKDMTELIGALDDKTGAVILPEEKLINLDREMLQDWINKQAPWSDMPLLVLTHDGADSSAVLQAIKTLRNVTLLERPLRVSTLVSTVRSALRARLRQHQIRDYLGERLRMNEVLEERVKERTAVASQRAVQLSALAAELTEAEERERRRLAQVLHDHLQQLLVAAKLNLGILERRVNDTDRNDVHRVDELIRESIDLSRSLAVELSPPILYEAGLVAAVQWLGRWMGEKHGLVTYVEAEKDLVEIPENQRVLLFQVIRELLFNVVKHAGSDEAYVIMNCDDDGRIRISVQDDGRGFDVDSISGDHATSGEHFGLFSIDERLRLMHGSIDVNSTPGKGTVVNIEIAIEACASSSETSADVAAAGDRPRKRTGRSRVRKRTGADANAIRILLVDDHKIVREGLASILRTQEDFEIVAEASDGRTAIDLVHRTQPQVVIMDVTMPEMSGVEATREIMSRHPHLRVIGLSMHEKADMEEAMKSAGAVAYLTKGGPAEQLIGAIRQAAAVVQAS